MPILSSFPNAGPTGPQGPQGQQGNPGAAATINGVNTLTIQAGDGLSATQSGSTLTLSLNLDNYDGGAF